MKETQQQQQQYNNFHFTFFGDIGSKWRRRLMATMKLKTIKICVCGEWKYTHKREFHEIIAILMKPMYRGLLIIYAFSFELRKREHETASERGEKNVKMK